MLRRILLAFTEPELRNKIIQIILLLISVRLLAHIPIPLLGIQDISNTINSDAVLSLLNTISGGGYGTLSFVMLGVVPFVNASIIMQLLGVLFPRIREIQREEGEAGRNKINRWTRLLVVPLSMIQAWGTLNFLAADNGTSTAIVLPEVLRPESGAITTESFLFWLVIVASMTAGSLIIMWVAEIITEFKLGNGVTIMITTGIISRLPGSIYNTIFGNPQTGQPGVWPNIVAAWNKMASEPSLLLNWEAWQNFWWTDPQWATVRNFIFLVVIFILILAFVIWVNDAVRRIMIVYSRRGHNQKSSRTIEQVKSDLPMKVNQAGVIPIIFAVTFILFPAIMARFFQTANQTSLREGARSVSDFLSADPIIGARLLPFQISNETDVANGVKLVHGASNSNTPGINLANLHNYNDLQWFEGFQFENLNIDWIPQFVWTFDGILAYNFFYFFFIIFFTYFYSHIIFNTKEVSEDLQKSGAYIPGYRPGEETEKYLSGVSNRLNLPGSFFLAIIAILPIVFSNNFTFGGQSSILGIIGGTSLLILVSGTIETLKQIETQAISIDYDRFSK